MINAATSGTGLFAPENILRAAELTLPFLALAGAKDDQQQINPRNLGVNLDDIEQPWQIVLFNQWQRLVVFKVLKRWG